jgi:hypothetical protein
MIPARLSFAPYKTDVVELKGGINENVSSLELRPGELIDVKNYMIAEGNYSGYISMKGYERMDGALRPSMYESYVLTIESTGTVAEGDVLVAPSGAQATALGPSTEISTGFIEVEATIDTATRFVSGDTVEILGVPLGTISGTAVQTGGTSEHYLAIEYARSLVMEVPGEGPVLGVHYFAGKVYAWRKHIGFNTIGMYVEDAVAGWDEIDTSADPLVYTGDHEFHFTNNNFMASVDSYSFFFTDTQNQCRMYNEVAGISTINNAGMSALSLDKPINVVAHNDYLFLAYRGGSLQHSVLGDPTDWTGASGAGEIACGAEITGLVAGLKGTLVIFMDEGIKVLNGVVASEFSLEAYSKQSGAFPNTTQRMLGTILFVDDRGLSTLAGVDTFGDYGAATISQRFKRTLKSKIGLITTSVVSRDLNQYRLFFEDGTGLIASFEGQELQGATLFEYPDVVRCISSGDQQGDEVIVFASDDGYVYRMDSGTSFDSAPIITRLTTAFFHYGSPRNWKNFKRATFEIKGENGQLFNVRLDFDYNEPGVPYSIWNAAYVYALEGTAIYGSSLWGSMIYGSGTTATSRVPVYLRGVGTNASYKIISNEAYREQHIVQNIITDYEILSRRV